MGDELMGLADVVVTPTLVGRSAVDAEPAPAGWTTAQDQMLPKRSMPRTTPGTMRFQQRLVDWAGLDDLQLPKEWVVNGRPAALPFTQALRTPSLVCADQGLVRQPTCGEPERQLM